MQLYSEIIIIFLMVAVSECADEADKLFETSEMTSFKPHSMDDSSHARQSNEPTSLVMRFRRGTRRICGEHIIIKLRRHCHGCIKPLGTYLMPLSGTVENMDAPSNGRRRLTGTLTEICCSQGNCFSEVLDEFCCTEQELDMLKGRNM